MDDRSKIELRIVSLSKTKFRGSFHLNKKMKNYVLEKGIKEIERHAYEFINKRLRVIPLNDGKQIPMRKVHPVFIAQHACGFCCRGCLEKIHHIPKTRDLTDDEVKYIVKFIMIWINKEMNRPE